MPSLSHQLLYRGFVYIAGLYILALFITPYLTAVRRFIKKQKPYLKSLFTDYRPHLKSFLTDPRQHLNPLHTDSKPYLQSILTDYKRYITSLLAVKDYDYRLIPTLRLTSLLATSIITIILYHNDCWPATSLLSSLTSALYIHHRYIGRHLYHPKTTRQAIVFEVLKDWILITLPINEATRQEIGFEVLEGWIINAPTKVKEFVGWLFQKETRNRRRIPARQNHLL